MPEDWALGSEVIGETIEEVREWATLELVIRYKQSESGSVVSEITSGSNKVEVFEKQTGGFAAVDLSDGDNVLDLNAPDDRSQVRSVDQWLIDSYDDTLMDKSGDAYELELELVPLREKDRAGSEFGTIVGAGIPDRTKDNAEWYFDFGRYQITTRNVTIDTTESDDGSRDVYELEMFLNPVDVRIIEENISYLNLSTLREIPDSTDLYDDTHPQNRNTIVVQTPFFRSDPIANGVYLFRGWETEWVDDSYRCTWQLGFVKEVIYPQMSGFDSDQSGIELDLLPAVYPDSQDAEKSEIGLWAVQKEIVADGQSGPETKTIDVDGFATALVYVQHAPGGIIYEDSSTFNEDSDTTFWQEFVVDVDGYTDVEVTAGEAGQNRKIRDFGNVSGTKSGGSGGSGHVNGASGGPIDFDDGSSGDIGVPGAGGGGGSQFTIFVGGIDYQEVAEFGGKGGDGGTVSGGGGGAVGGIGGDKTTDSTVSGASSRQDGSDGDTALNNDASPSEVGGSGGDASGSQDPLNDVVVNGGFPDNTQTDFWQNIAEFHNSGFVSVDVFAIGDPDADENTRPEGAIVKVQLVQ